MPVAPTRRILDRAFAERVGVAAINVVDELTMQAVLEAAESVMELARDHTWKFGSEGKAG